MEVHIMGSVRNAQHGFNGEIPRSAIVRKDVDTEHQLFLEQVLEAAEKMQSSLGESQMRAKSIAAPICTQANFTVPTLQIVPTTLHSNVSPLNDFFGTAANQLESLASPVSEVNCESAKLAHTTIAVGQLRQGVIAKGVKRELGDNGAAGQSEQPTKFQRIGKKQANVELKPTQYTASSNSTENGVLVAHLGDGVLEIGVQKALHGNTPAEQSEQPARFRPFRKEQANVELKPIQHTAPSKNPKNRVLETGAPESDKAGLMNAAPKWKRRRNRGPKNLKCPECDVRFHQPSAVRSHVRTVHLGERRFPCRIPGCTKRFGASGDVTRHINSVHLAKREFKCDVCGALLSRNTVRYRHMRHVHGIEPLPGRDGRSQNGQ